MITATPGRLTCFLRILLAAAVVACAHPGVPAPACEGREQPVDAKDLELIERARELLPSAEVWNRRDDRNCPAAAQSRSLFCALHDA
jgi:hypothetical protein